MDVILEPSASSLLVICWTPPCQAEHPVSTRYMLVSTKSIRNPKTLLHQKLMVLSPSHTSANIESIFIYIKILPKSLSRSWRSWLSDRPVILLQHLLALSLAVKVKGSSTCVDGELMKMARKSPNEPISLTFGWVFCIFFTFIYDIYTK